MGERSAQFDIIRVIAITFTVTCHYFLFCGVYPELGRYLAGGGNILFFLLSAMLFGLKWNSNGRKCINAHKFFRKRIVRLGASLWPFLFCLFILFCLFQDEIPIIKFILNFFFLGAFSKLPGNAHSWFLTVMMMCYAEFVVLSRFKLKSIYLYILTVVSVIAYCLMEYNSLPGNFLLILMMSGWIFLKSEAIMNALQNNNGWGVAGVSIVLNIFTIWLLGNGFYDNNRILAYPLLDVCGLSLFLCLLKFSPNKKNRVVVFFSGISYELYLVHQNLCAGPFTKVTQWSDSRWVQFVLFILVSVVLAYALNKISFKVKNLIEG